MRAEVLTVVRMKAICPMPFRQNIQNAQLVAVCSRYAVHFELIDCNRNLHLLFKLDFAILICYNVSRR